MCCYYDCYTLSYNPVIVWHTYPTFLSFSFFSKIKLLTTLSNLFVFRLYRIDCHHRSINVVIIVLLLNIFRICYLYTNCIAFDMRWTYGPSMLCSITSGVVRQADLRNLSGAITFSECLSLKR